MSPFRHGMPDGGAFRGGPAVSRRILAHVDILRAGSLEALWFSTVRVPAWWAVLPDRTWITAMAATRSPVYCNGEREPAIVQHAGSGLPDRGEIPADKPSRAPVYSIGEGERRIGVMRHFRCGYPSPKPTRRAVNFNGERRHWSVPHADDGVDIPAPTPLETLCNRMVSTRAGLWTSRSAAQSERCAFQR